MRKDARQILDAAIDSVSPGEMIRSHLRWDGDVLQVGQQRFNLEETNKVYVIAAGKASALMAVHAEQILEARIYSGLVVTKYQHALPLKRLECIEAGHPVPDQNGMIAAEKIASLLNEAGENDLVILLLSGGASALIADVPGTVSLAEMQALADLLLRSGADIAEINTVRKHLSVLKGGRFAEMAWPATVVSLVLSDVMGDPPEVIGSGPTVADPTTFTDALRVLENYQLTGKVSEGIIQLLRDGQKGIVAETPKPGGNVLSKSFFDLIGNNSMAMDAAAKKAGDLGYYVVLEKEPLRGEAKQLAVQFLQKAIGYNGKKPVCFIAGGESTVTLTGNGKGGRNQELVLSAVVHWRDQPDSLKDVLLMSAATDGTDGPTDAAGAWADQQLIDSIEKKNLDPVSYLYNNDAYTFFSLTDAQIITGPTQTNVMDIVIVLIDGLTD